ncbi:MAG: hypothetical protein WEC33_02770, partial [Dehalococcoidia bacterium]
DFIGQPAELRAALAGIDPGTLNRRPVGSDWSIRDRVIYLADTEQWLATAVHLSLTADLPAIPAPVDSAFVRRLHYLWRDPEAALSLFQQARWANAELLESLDVPQWQREALVDGAPLTIATLLALAVQRGRDQLAGIAAATAR